MRILTHLLPLGLVAVTAAASPLRNADFSEGTSGWSLELHDPAQASWEVAGHAPGDTKPTGNAVCFTLEEAEGQAWDYQLLQRGFALEPGEHYVLSFWGNSTNGQPVGIAVNQGHEPWQAVGLKQRVPLAPRWGYYEVPFTASDLAGGDLSLSFNLGYEPGRLWLADVRLRSRDEPSVNLLRDGEFLNESAQWVVRGRQHQGFDASYESMKALLSRTEDVSGGPIACIDVREAGLNAWGVKLQQNGLRLEPGAKYRLAFQACSSPAREMRVSTMLDHAPWSFTGLRQSVNLGNSWKRYECEFVSESEANETVQLGLAVGVPVGKVWISDVSLERIGKQ